MTINHDNFEKLARVASTYGFQAIARYGFKRQGRGAIAVNFGKSGFVRYHSLEYWLIKSDLHCIKKEYLIKAIQEYDLASEIVTVACFPGINGYEVIACVIKLQRSSHAIE